MDNNENSPPQLAKKLFQGNEAQHRARIKEQVFGMISHFLRTVSALVFLFVAVAAVTYFYLLFFPEAATQGINAVKAIFNH